MIKILKVHIEEVRGIRRLDIDMQGDTFAISGPNGSGKSGVIDAIEFCLTGEISRLTGRGTKGLTISEHGPHVDRVKFPDAAFVTLEVLLTDINKTASITRKIRNPGKPIIEPKDADIVAALSDVADHPEITLSRRELLRFILSEPKSRAEDVQALLKLDELTQVRNALNSAQNKLDQARKGAEVHERNCRENLKTHLQLPVLKNDQVLEVVNQRRRLLGLNDIIDLTADTKFDADIGGEQRSEFNKQSALRDISALSDAGLGFAEAGKTEAELLLADIAKLESDAALSAALLRRPFYQKGLELVSGPDCPLCDTGWASEEALRERLSEKLNLSVEARKIQERMTRNSSELSRESLRIANLVGTVQRVAEGQAAADFANALRGWKASLEMFGRNVATEAMPALKARLAAGWLQVPAQFAKYLAELHGAVSAKPDQTATVGARTFLTAAQLRLADMREAARKKKAADIAHAASEATYDTFIKVLEDKLNQLYDDVQKDFGEFYRAVNEDDEMTFAAKLTPMEGSLGLDVNFYDRGLFPPAAYHSEGHQDGMGVCLYLALMRRLLGGRFCLALLDDVVMSVDTNHRYQFCKLLKTAFPDTQFIITTHDKVWAEQMRSAGLVTTKTSLRFHSWSIDGGPVVESSKDIWEKIAEDLAKDDVRSAAGSLRHHLEYVSQLLADQLGASIQFRADGNYELNDLLPGALKRLGELYSKATDSAQSWKNEKAKEAVAVRRAALAASNGARNVEQWAVNKAVHYNAWANFSKRDFEPVVLAFRGLLECFQCKDCGSWFYVSPRGASDSVRCGCGNTVLNLKMKPK